MQQNGEPNAVGRWISTGSRNLDRLLGGGIELERITEIHDEAGTGKSQFAYTLSVTSQLPEANLGGRRGRAIVLHAYSNFPTKRLLDISEGHGLAQDVLHGMEMAEFKRVTELLTQLDRILERFRSKPAPTLVTVDDAAALFQRKYESSWDYFERQSVLGKFIDKARSIVEELGSALVFTNRVVGRSKDDELGREVMVTEPYGRETTERLYVNRLELVRRDCLMNTHTCRLHSRPENHAAVEVRSSIFAISNHGIIDAP